MADADARRITRFYFMLQVGDMARAVAFYTSALGTELRHESPQLSEVHVGDVTVCLKAGGSSQARRSTGLMIEVPDLATTCDAIIAGGGEVLTPVGPTVEAVDAADTEGNLFTVVPQHTPERAG